ncbi:hypothetical protein P152DRAFT_445123 [Eremomyces bilateralis CBS 781.70]|uniref:mitogen-activated protein kinase n=1 Tax=Eremomyces bilateralis CBS 781.70 TaxID=1392243 RepID=A0A6G1GGF9_9PEZI|nr:uncharacterized protein P152DRAFT_445123 [Eremomyces bilateralis CBS 781.70]KAF1816959.1 hypothetical protein P152DRAFT_445123 [Eremomyces bilateralis CBS 781.70]
MQVSDAGHSNGSAISPTHYGAEEDSPTSIHASHDEMPEGSGGSGGSGPEDADDLGRYDSQSEMMTPLQDSSIDELPPLAGSWSSSASAQNALRHREGTGSHETNASSASSSGNPPPIQTGGRSSRPSVVRTPSNTYAPQRRPTNHTQASSSRQRGSSLSRSSRQTSQNDTNPMTRVWPRNPNAEYRAQEAAYMKRIRQDGPREGHFFDPELRTPSLDPGSNTPSEQAATDDEGESLASADYFDNDSYDPEALLYYGNDDNMQPSVEELKIPANRERLEWHSMLASVLTGDVVKQEKKRLIGTGENVRGDHALKAEMWLEIRAKVCGRAILTQQRLLDEGRQHIRTMFEEVITFEVQGVSETGKAPLEQVKEIVKKIDKIESMYPTTKDLLTEQPRAQSREYKSATETILAWLNTMELMHIELETLKTWVGNEELNLRHPRTRLGYGGSPQDTPGDSSTSSSLHLNDDSSFVDRIMRDDGLQHLLGQPRHPGENALEKLVREKNILGSLAMVTQKAKDSVIQFAEGFHERHLPPFIEELQILINFPTRLVKEIIKMRLDLAKSMKDPAQQGVLMTEQMIAQFQLLLHLAVLVKEAYGIISRPQPGWDPPDCIEEDFDVVVVDAMKFYFRMLNWKLSANKNTFKEAEILLHEWTTSNELGRHLNGGDVEVAEQFSMLTSKSMARLTGHFEQELRRPLEEIGKNEMEKRYKLILDSVRVRQRALFRFSRTLTDRFENCTEYNINIDREQQMELYDALIYSGHFLVENTMAQNEDIYIIASPALEDRDSDIFSLMGTYYHPEDNPDDPSNPYVLILKPESPLIWAGAIVKMSFQSPVLDLKTGRLRLVADGSQQRLANAKLSFTQAISMPLNILIEERANLPRVNQELHRIKKTAYKLSNTIMDSVEIIRNQTKGYECQELIQTCFAFATEFGQRSVLYMDFNRRALNNARLTKLALEWIAFICDDCVASDKRTFRWAVVALEFAMVMTRGNNLLSLSDGDYAKLRAKVAGCMSLLISHFDIMGARSTLAAQIEKQQKQIGKHFLDVSKLKDDEESAMAVRLQWVEQLDEIERLRREKESERQALGRVLEGTNEAERALTYLSASASNVTLRWQQGQFVGGGTFGSVYAALNMDTGQLMAVKEIRLQDPQLIPNIVGQIRDEMSVLQVLDHPNIVSYYGIEPHRDKVYIFMEYCNGGSVSALLEHGRIEDENIIQVYALQMLEGLAYLHERRVVHRDIKPENILFDQDGIIKFVDFGTAKVIARHSTTFIYQREPQHAQSSTHQQNVSPSDLSGIRNPGPPIHGRQNSMTGTPMYMSPEVIKGNTEGRLGAVDIWSLGCVILEMVTGRRPWAALDNEWAIMYNIAQGNPPQLPSRDQLSHLGVDFLNKCFERDPTKRGSAAELLQHDWIIPVRRQLSLQVDETARTPGSEASSFSAASSISRHSSHS